MPKEGQQTMYISQNGSALHRYRKELGDEKIKPKEKKKIKREKRHHGLKPFDEVIAYEAARQAKIDQKGVVQEETLDGGLIIRDTSSGATQITYVGEADADDRPTNVISRTLPQIPVMSDKARGLHWKFKREGKFP